ncbi:retrovirus-related pol polyprotein from transposon TNT 1-94 [Tanacetum coccineum]|uniref:Retrovirus-related pol polyprotein from transposon TNT 1-94 n=1 Tax=Tanacetum coccineum TaxID=301880 RepID=A0ABQ5AMV3_9ASTR
MKLLPVKEKVVVITALKNDLRKLKGKEIIDNAAQMSNAATIAPGMYKLDPVFLAHKVKNNRQSHEYYLKHTMEQAAILRAVVEQAKSRNLLDSASYSACMYVKLIQELLGYIRDTCPDIHKPSKKLVAVTPINKMKIVQFADTITSSGNIPKVTNRPLLSSTGVDPSTSASGSKPLGNTKNDRIPRTPSSNEKNKVEHPVKGAKALCSVCNECLFAANHDMCLIDHVNSMNMRAKCASKKNKKRKERLTATNKVPFRVPIPLELEWNPMNLGDRILQLLHFLLLLSSTGCPNCSVLFGLRMLQAHDWRSLLAHQFRNVTISRVYNVEGLGHNLFSVGQFCHLDREVAFRKHTCFVHNLEDNGTEYVNQTLQDYYEHVGIFHETLVARTPQQNGVVERRNRTLIEAARTIYGPRQLLPHLTAIASEQSSLEPVLYEMTPAIPSSGLVPNPPPLAPFVPPSRHEWDLVFQLVFDEFFYPPASVAFPVPVEEASAPVESTGSPFLTTVDQDAPSPKTVSEESSSSDVIPTTVHSDAPISEHLIKPNTYKDALTQSCWIEAMQEELHEFERLKVWELVPRLDKVMVM